MIDERRAAGAGISRQWLHDLRAPLITMRGFGDELTEALARLIELVEAHQHDLPDDFVALTRDVLERDMGPCLGFLQSSVSRLGDVLDDVPAIFASDSE